MPSDPMYLPVYCGAVGKESIGFQRDDEGENISHKNANYCELTGLYWAWKNLDADAIGLVHYRRHFSVKRFGDKWDRILTQTEAESLLEINELILPTKRRYYIETNYSHYIHSHKREGLDIAGEYVKSLSKDYAQAWDKVMNRTWAYICNMMIMRKSLFDSYCAWLFDVLNHVEERIYISDYDATEARVFGFISEWLFDIWILANGIKGCEISAITMEKIDWINKYSSFIRRKLF
jgi:hypothetical protein